MVKENASHSLSSRELHEYIVHRLFERVPAIIATLSGPDHIFEMANLECHQMAGDREFMNKPVETAFPKLKEQGFIELLDKVYRSGEAYEGEEKLVYLNRLDGRGWDEHYFNYVLQPIFSDNEDVTGTFIHAVDVTEHVMARRQLEKHTEALRNSEERFRTIGESTTEYAIFTMDLGGRINSWNSGARRLLGWQSSEAIGQFGDIIFPDRKGSGSDKALRELEIAYQTGSATNERWHVRKDGSFFWASSMVMAITSERGSGTEADEENHRNDSDAAESNSIKGSWGDAAKGDTSNGNISSRITGFVKIIQDTTERKYREVQDKFLIKLSDTLRPISDPVRIQFDASRILGSHLGVAQVGYAKVDTDEIWATTEGEYNDGRMQPFKGRRITLNSFGTQILEIARSGRNIVVNDVLADERTSTPEARKTYSFLGIRSFVITPLVKEGRLSAYLFATNPEPASWTEADVSLMRETAERTWASVQRARAESAMKKSEMQLRSLNETLEERINNRTAALVSYKDKLRSLAAELNRAEERERQNLAAELHDNLGQILAMSKMELDLMKLNSGSDEMRSGIKTLTSLINEGIRYTRELMSDLKPPPSLDKEDVWASIDWVARIMRKHGLEVTVKDDGKPKPLSEEVRSTLVQSVKELLFNVVKHAGVKEARIELTRLGQQIRTSIIDRGRGYDPEEQATREDDGGGFGLFNIRERMDLLEGRVEIQSKRGEGTTINLYAPLGSKHEPDESVRQTETFVFQEPAIRTYTRSGDEITVLLVDDHDMMREGLHEMIEAQKDMVVIAEATNGKDAIELTRKHSPDVIVMDVDMPQMNGIDATFNILTEYRDVRVIGLSLHENPDVERSMRRAGASAYLTKTEVFETLCETIRKEAALAKQ